MNFSMLPSNFKKEAEKELNQTISDLEKQESNRNWTLNNSKSNTSNSGSIFLGLMGAGAAIGAVIGIIVCFSSGDAINAQTHALDSAGSAIMFWFLFIIIGGVLGAVIAAIITASKSSYNKSLDNQIANNSNNILLQKSGYVQSTNKKVNDYYRYFEEEAQRQSVHYVESIIAQDVINWITNGFVSTIKAADRREHIQWIDVPFKINVYSTKITCNLGTYDFALPHQFQGKTFRCENLTTPMQQAALTKALANAIRLNIAMQFPQDTSGTVPKIDIQYDYGTDDAIAIIRYTSANGNYISTTSW